METVLVVVAIVSLAGAAAMGLLAWRLSREERARSAARVAALAAAAASSHDDPAGARAHVPSVPPVPAPKAPHEPSPALPEAHLGMTRRAAPWNPPPPPAGAARLDDDASHDEVRHGMFLGTAGTRWTGSAQRALAVAAGVLLVVLLIGAYGVVFGDRPGGEPTVEQTSSPLELVSLRHERTGSRLSITGLVRNPASASTPVERVAAVVLLFDQQGTLVTSARSFVDYTVLPPGDESPFVVTLDAPPSVARYRVSFRNEAGVLPHVDRRGQEPLAGGLP